MMTSSEYIVLDEQARDLQKVYRSSENYSNMIFSHLLKLFFYNDGYYINKHCNDIDTWTRRIIKDKDLEVIPSKDKIKEKLFDSKFNNLLSIKMKRKDFKSNYGKLNSSELTDEEILLRLEKIYDRLSYEISLGKYQGIRNYLELKDRIYLSLL